MHSSNNVAMKRIQKEQRDMLTEPSPYFYAEPLENEPFEWHFTIRGPEETDFHNGFYHGVITLPNSYPFRPPYIVFLTPSGRFQVNEKICLTFTNFHPEFWQPAWTIRNILQALVSFMPVDDENHSVGATSGTKEERQLLARKSIEFQCPSCGPIRQIVKDKIPPLNDLVKLQQIKQQHEDTIFKFAPERQLMQQNHEAVKKEAEESVKEEIKHLIDVIEQKRQEQVKKESSPTKAQDLFNLDEEDTITEKKLPQEQQQSKPQEANPSLSQMEEDQREKLKKIRDKGLRVYKKRLLQQLEADCKKKLCVINMLFLICMTIVGAMYYSDFIIEVRLYDLLK